MADPAAPPPSGTAYADALDEFIQLWGTMATHWGINRTMAQIHALLFASGSPLDTDQIMERLHISRGNANMNLRGLLDWGLICKTHQAGSRKDFYVAEGDVWALTTTIIEERHRREILPVQRSLADVADGLRQDASGEAEAFAARIESLVDAMEVIDGFTTSVLPLLRGRHMGKVKRIVQFAARLREGDSGA